MDIIKLWGVLVHIYCVISSEFKAYVTMDKRGVKQLLLRCQNALYGKIVASMIHYCKFTKSLTSIGFYINPHDPCNSNKVIDSSQMKIYFHVDEFKLSFRESKANDCMIKWLCQEYAIIF